MGTRRSNDNDGASPGKIFIGGLARDTTSETFIKYFEKYGDITDFVIMKDRHTGRPRGFGFITFADPSVVDTVMQKDHVINGKQVEIKRTIPKGSSQSNDIKTKKLFVGGILTSVTEDEFKNFFSKYGEVVEHEIIRDHATKRSRGFGFIVFDSEEVVDNMLANGNLIDMEGTQVEIKKAEPKRASNPAPGPGYGLLEVLAVDLEIMVVMLVVVLILVVVMGGLVVVVFMVIMEIHHLVILAALVPMLVGLVGVV
ncbi:hypothetical protein ES332_D08G063000v1 [Gossypium tomentosum]|uniref:RRM domain-containing protein n=1 Tax=Gossypium tomentosum TaxID=34277 RepID=A0A5D2JQH3_GOSTO|nr:hypothetical protein ES332_D08G063000v1 [Gossypium tomentosum]